MAKNAVCEVQKPHRYAEMHFASRIRLAKCISDSQIGRGVPFLFATRNAIQFHLRLRKRSQMESQIPST
ncbi:hypothetical protein NDU88_007131 [Pleurodeles waltl]|uniref:Uncharacterized protein n=1 Tax=Pleurodeles waltl TaxID=8319 RepID=A0AAV7N5I2_PLEWA|nr:hypothetical protein NDU88_007131 [Pleurodeles waltl]